MLDFNNTNPVELHQVTIRMIENRSFRNWQEPNILKINHLISEFIDSLSESQFTNILSLSGWSVPVAQTMAKAAYEVKEDVDMDEWTPSEEGVRAIQEQIDKETRDCSDSFRINELVDVIADARSSLRESEGLSEPEFEGTDRIHEGDTLNSLNDTLKNLTSAIKQWDIKGQWKRACETVTEQASKASDTVQEAAKSKTIDFVKKHGTTITVTLLCRRFGLSPEVAQEIIKLFRD